MRQRISGCLAYCMHVRHIGSAEKVNQIVMTIFHGNRKRREGRALKVKTWV